MKVKFKTVSEVVDFIMESLAHGWPIRYYEHEILIKEEDVTKSLIMGLIASNAEIEILKKEEVEKVEEEVTTVEVSEEEFQRISEIVEPEQPERLEVPKELEEPKEPEQPTEHQNRKKSDKSDLKTITSLNDVEALKNILTSSPKEELVEKILTEVGWGKRAEKVARILEELPKEEKVTWMAIHSKAKENGFSLSPNDHKIMSDATSNYFKTKGFNVTFIPFVRLLKMEYDAKPATLQQQAVVSREPETPKVNQEEKAPTSSEGDILQINKLSEIPKINQILKEEMEPYKKIKLIWKEIEPGKNSQVFADIAFLEAVSEEELLPNKLNRYYYLIYGKEVIFEKQIQSMHRALTKYLKDNGYKSMPITVALQSLREEIDHKEDAVEFLKRRKFEEEFKYEELPVELKEKIIELGLDGRISQKTKMRNLIDFIDSTKNSEMNTMTRIATKAMELKTVSLPIICVNLEIVDSRRYEELWNKVMKGYFNKCMFKAEKIITFTRMLSSLKQFWV